VIKSGRQSLWWQQKKSAAQNHQVHFPKGKHLEISMRRDFIHIACVLSVSVIIFVMLLKNVQPFKFDDVVFYFN
jgi:hypothetical protein